MSQALPDCLIVLDTLGTRANAAIVGITAVRFDLDHEDHNDLSLELAVDISSNSDAGRTYDSNSMNWWAEQHDAIKILQRLGLPLNEALRQFADFYAGTEHLWVMGHGFESAVLEDAYLGAKQDLPWEYWSVMDGRTMLNLSAWLDDEQEPLTTRGISSLITARSRVYQLRCSYESLASKKKENHARKTA